MQLHSRKCFDFEENVSARYHCISNMFASTYPTHHSPGFVIDRDRIVINVICTGIRHLQFARQTSFYRSIVTKQVLFLGEVVTKVTFEYSKRPKTERLLVWFLACLAFRCSGLENWLKWFGF